MKKNYYSYLRKGNDRELVKTNPLWMVFEGEFHPIMVFYWKGKSFVGN